MNLKLTPICFTLFLVSCLLLTHDVAAQKTIAALVSDSVVFNFKAGPQFWQVPQGVTYVHVNASGAQGGSAKGGKGGNVQSDLTVTPGAKLIIYVGSQPAKAEGGENGGGSGCGNGTGGGGSSDIRIGGSNLSNRVLVAGGGGGFGYGGTPGEGGGLTGGEGRYDTSHVHIAGGGTQAAGGAGARAYFSKAGDLGVGGQAIDNNGKCSNGAMGGGGGGYYGGGASGAGGGGGGSSYTDPKLNNKVVHEQGVHTGNGRIVLTWTK